MNPNNTYTSIAEAYKLLAQKGAESKTYFRSLVIAISRELKENDPSFERKRFLKDAGIVLKAKKPDPAPDVASVEAESKTS